MKNKILTRDFARGYFKGSRIKLDYVNNYMILLILVLQEELSEYLKTEDGKNMGLEIKLPNDKDIKLSKGNFISASLRMKGSYFKDREAITFYESGFIGFAGRLDNTNVQPILRAFVKWCDLVKERSA